MLTKAQAIDHIEDLADVCEKNMAEIVALQEQKRVLFNALRDMTEWWAHAIEKPPGAQPDADDEKRVEQLAVAAAEALFAADPNYVVKRPKGH